MDVEDLAKFLVVVSVVVLPAMAITARFALKPIVDAILRLKESGFLSPPSTSASELQLLRAEVAELQQEVARLREAEEFHHALTRTSEAQPLHLPAGGGPSRQS